MRWIISLTAGLGLSGPALADMEADFARAASIFGPVTVETVLDDIDGEWLPLSTLANLTGEAPSPGLATSLTGRICGLDPVRGSILTATGESGFTVDVPSRDQALTYRFDWIGGAQFVRSVDAAALFSSLGLDAMKPERRLDAQAAALRSAATVTAVYRVSPDMIVVASPDRTEIFGRCPRDNG
ncbi:hypothetical protein [Pseudotabrizicola sp. 4114]|uniref:hypothetical protein n=1 Tax=Pseudotabrizicola sp. 4114 TaxID=2817731 RepID=UPI002862F50B|nr:hypothetical protein [Pseudorhodobacter sp. 4114]